MAKSGDEPTDMDRLQDELAAADGASFERAKAKTRGGKLNRSETVTVRLDPKLNYLCELAARAQRRTKSSFIEWAIENALKDVVIPGTVVARSVADQSLVLWDVDEADRVIALGFNAEALLTHDEQRYWKVLTTSPRLWKGHVDSDGEWNYEVREWTLLKGRVRESWENIKAVADGTAERQGNTSLISPSAEIPSSSVFDGIDADVPF